jgi:hypothetical protein
MTALHNSDHDAFLGSVGLDRGSLVLERYSHQKCSLLRNCTSADVIAARIRAIQQIGNPAERYGKIGSIGVVKRSPSMELTAMKGTRL